MLVLLEERDNIGSCSSSASCGSGSWGFDGMILRSGEHFRVIIKLGFVGSLPTANDEHGEALEAILTKEA
jgi:hypothetical protein